MMNNAAPRHWKKKKPRVCFQARFPHRTSLEWNEIAINLPKNQYFLSLGIDCRAFEASEEAEWCTVATSSWMISAFLLFSIYILYNTGSFFSRTWLYCVTKHSVKERSDLCTSMASTCHTSKCVREITSIGQTFLLRCVAAWDHP